MSFEARNALMLAKKVLDKAAEYKKVAQKKEGGATNAKPKDNLAAFLKDKHKSIPHVVYHHGSFDETEDGVPNIGKNGMHFGTRQAAEERAFGKYRENTIDNAEYHQDEHGKWHWYANGIDSQETRPFGFNSKEIAKHHLMNEFETWNEDFVPEQLGKITEAHLAIKNPKRVTDQVDNWEDAIKKAKEEGHDGLIYRNQFEDKGKDSYVVFYPHQIKSATGNQGTFDPTNPDITKAGGGEVARKTNKIGLYSKAAEQARQIPSGSVPAAQLIGTLRNKGGIKAEELANAGITDQAGNLSPEWQAKGKIAPEDLAAHFEEHLPEIEETVLGHTIKGIPYPEEYRKIEQSILAKYKPDLERLHQINIDPSHDRETRNKALDEKEALQEKMWSEIDAAIPDRERHVEASRDKITPTKYHEYTLPGGENYREVLLRMPDKTTTHYLAQNKYGASGGPFNTREEALAFAGEGGQVLPQIKNEGYNKKLFKSSHWDEPNILAHIRMADRTGPNGEKILHVEEVQSDWGQKGKKEGFVTSKDDFNNVVEQIEQNQKKLGKKYNELISDGSASLTSVYDHPEYKEIADKLENLRVERDQMTKRVQSAPYVTSTQGWTDLALKRILKEAAEGGYDKIVWTPGAEQVGRYDLSKSLSKIAYNPDTGYFQALDLSGNPAINKKIATSELPDLVGKETAEKLLSQQPNNLGVHQLETSDLTIGGEGMKEYYDKILPNRLQSVAKKHDKTAKLAYSQVSGTGRYEVVLPNGKVIADYPDRSSADIIAGKQQGATVRTNNLSLPGLDITPQMRESILSGQEAYARGGDVMHTRKVPKPHTPVVGERQHKTRHPAMMIPGIHVVGAIHGIPYFTGKK